MVDKIKPLGLETSIDGTEIFPTPTELDPDSDYVAVKGIALENSDNTTIEGDSGVMKFKDTEVTAAKTLKDAMERIKYKDVDYTSIANKFSFSWDSGNNKFILAGANGLFFDNTIEGLLIAQNVQDAIDEITVASSNSSRSFTLASYGGNANAGRYLELFPSINMLEAPLYVVSNFNVISIVSQTTALTATCTIGFYNITPITPTLLYTTTFSAAKRVINTGTASSPLFTLPAGGQLAIKIDSGSIAKPHLYFTGQGG